MSIIEKLNSEKIFDKAKPLVVAAVCLGAVFAAGYGVGKSGSTNTQPVKRSFNYTTPTGVGQKAPNNVNTAPTNNTQTNSANSNINANETTKKVDPNNCYIKGSKSKTYHMPGGAFYARTTPTSCFNSEEEAQAAGYKKSSK